MDSVVSRSTLRTELNIFHHPFGTKEYTKDQRIVPSVTNVATENEAFVSGPYYFMLRISSMFGVAPLKFRQHWYGYKVSISKPMCIYSYIMVTVMTGIAFYDLWSAVRTSEWNAELSSSYRLTRLIVVLDMLLVIIRSVVCVFGAPARIKRMMKLMTSIVAVDRTLNMQISQVKEWRLIIVLAICMIYNFFFIIYRLLVQNHNNNESISMAYGNVIHIFNYLNTVMMAQFAITVLMVYKRFRAINQMLTDCVSRYSLKGMSLPLLEQSLHDTVQSIAILQSSLYEMIHEITKNYSLALILTFLSLIFHLICDPYNVILQMNKSNSEGSNVAFQQSLWFIHYWLLLLIAVEPCHDASTEGNKTERIVNRLVVMAPTEGPLAIRLELFARQLILQNICFKPMGLISLNRPCLVSIVGVMVTYLLILLQF